MSKLYAAYGSNISERQMRERVGRNAQLVGKSWLVNYRLVFRGKKNAATANIERSDGGERVPIYLWRLNEVAERILDRFEGVPHHYRKELVKVEYCGLWQQAMVYVMVPGRPLNKPSDEYYTIIEESYVAQAMPLRILKEARDRSTKK